MTARQRKPHIVVKRDPRYPALFKAIDMTTIASDPIPDKHARLLIELQKRELTPLAIHWASNSTLFETVLRPENFTARQCINERMEQAACASGWVAMPISGSDRVSLGYVAHFSAAIFLIGVNNGR